MEWLAEVFQSEILSVLIPVIIIITIFFMAARSAHRKHKERLDKINRSLNPEEFNNKS